MVDHKQYPDVGVVAIGRNEGERLRRCLASIGSASSRVYVDSGSTDDSIEWARANGVDVVELATPPKFTAARARNAGMKRLLEANPSVSYIQFVDGDCELRDGWLDAGVRALERDPKLAAVFGRRRERFPEHSIYNALCDDEWNIPVGPASACGGDILCRVEALAGIGGYDGGMIAGEDPDMAVRLRNAGWHLLRIDAEMTWHDAAILHFSQWWKRSQRAGHAFGDLAGRHPRLRSPNWTRQCWSIMAWSTFPLLIVAVAACGALTHNSLLAAAAIALALVWVAKVLQIAVAKRARLPAPIAIAAGFFIMLGKIPEMHGLLRYYISRLTGNQLGLIEYKTVSTDG